MSIAKVNGVDLYYEVHGEGEPLVLISGYTQDHTSWAAMLPVFAKKYRTIVLDNRGAGQTVCPDGPFTIEDMADDVSGLLDTLNIKKAHIIGISMGGIIAQALAIRHPEKVKGLVLCSTGSKGSPRSKFILGTLAEELATGKIDHEFYYKMVFPMLFSNNVFANRDMFKMIMSRTLASKINPNNVLRQRQAIDVLDLTALLGSIKAPTLVVHGNEDILFPIGYGKELATDIPNAKLVVLEGGNHMAYAEMADKVVPAVMGFLASVDGNATITPTPQIKH